MSLDFTLIETTIVADYNITHNLNDMAEAAGIYEALWRPEEIDCHYAKDIISRLEIGLKELKNNPDKYKKYEPENGWGTYDNFVPWVSKVLESCKENPEAEIQISR